MSTSGHPAMTAVNAKASRRYAPWLWLLLGLFTIRVVAQPIALRVDTPLLPRFESWYSGVLPYPLLVLTQGVIMLWLTRTAWMFSTGAIVPRPRFGIVMMVLGGIYFVAMVMRLLLGATILSHERWFASPVPTVFHLVLATYVLLYGHFHWRYGSNLREPLEESW
jgi:hypothetical protein